MKCIHNICALQLCTIRRLFTYSKQKIKELLNVLVHVYC